MKYFPDDLDHLYRTRKSSIFSIVLYALMMNVITVILISGAYIVLAYEFNLSISTQLILLIVFLIFCLIMLILSIVNVVGCSVKISKLTSRPADTSEKRADSVASFPPAADAFRSPAAPLLSYCTACGGTLPPDSQFCNHCGQKILVDPSPITPAKTLSSSIPQKKSYPSVWDTALRAEEEANYINCRYCGARQEATRSSCRFCGEKLSFTKTAVSSESQSAAMPARSPSQSTSIFPPPVKTVISPPVVAPSSAVDSASDSQPSKTSSRPEKHYTKSCVAGMILAAFCFAYAIMGACAAGDHLSLMSALFLSFSVIFLISSIVCYCNCFQNRKTTRGFAFFTVIFAFLLIIVVYILLIVLDMYLYIF